MNLLYLVFGSNIKHHFQANFSILSFLAYRKELTSITVVTDAPEFYQHLSAFVTVLPVQEETLQQWKGKHNFFWRIKLKALEYVAQQHPDTAILYLDSDTFRHGSFAKLAGLLRQGHGLMHESEGALATLGSKTEKLMWSQVQGKEFGGVRLHQRHEMWNAGVVGIPAQRAGETIALALRICDALSEEQVTPRLIEQFALSVALAETGGLRTARPFIGHYWSNKEEWNDHIGAFFLASHLQDRSVMQDIEALAHFNFRAIPIKKRLKNTQHRLERLIRKIFPPKEITYIDDADLPDGTP